MSLPQATLAPRASVVVRIPRGGVRTLRRLLDAVLVGMILVVVGTGLLARFGPSLGFEALSIRGASMSPAIGVGAMVVVDREPGELAPGDIIAFDAGQAVVTHRIIAVERGDGTTLLRTQGDANPNADPLPVPLADTIGRVEFVVPGLGYVLWMTSLPLGIAAILCSFAALLALVWLLEDLEMSRARRMALG